MRTIVTLAMLIGAVGCGASVVIDPGGGSAGAGGEGAVDAGGDAPIVCGYDAGPVIPILAGSTYGEYNITSIVLEGAPCGTYTFAYLGPKDPTATQTATVMLRRDGNDLFTLAYNWQTTVSAPDIGLTFTFDFDGHFAITVEKAGTGTMNLWDMPDSIFDGQHAIIVP